MALPSERIEEITRCLDEFQTILPELASATISLVLRMVMEHADHDQIRAAAAASVEQPEDLFGTWSRPDHPGAYEADILREIQGDGQLRQLSDQGATFVISSLSRFTIKISGDDLEISKAGGKPLTVMPRQSNVILVR